jgi:hypothetical protein
MSVDIGARRSDNAYIGAGVAVLFEKAGRCLFAGIDSRLNTSHIDMARRHLGTDLGNSDTSLKDTVFASLVVDQTLAEAFLILELEARRLEQGPKDAQNRLAELSYPVRLSVTSPDTWDHIARRFPSLTADRAKKAIHGLNAA